MRRALLVILIAAVAAAAAVLPRPDAAPEPLADRIIDDPGLATPVDAGIWYCPWAQANAARDSLVAVATMAPATASLTFPVAIPGEPPDEAELATLGPGAAHLTLSDLAQRGDSPSFIEFDAGPASAGVIVTGDVISADACVATGPSEWLFVAGSTQTGEQLSLRLFNPFPETAKVTVSGFSEIGVEALGELRGITVNPRSWRDVALEELLRQRQDLVISVRVDEGLVVPAMSFVSGDDEAWWAGTDIATEWEFPVARIDGLDAAAVVVANPGLTPAEVVVDIYTPDGPTRAVTTVTAEPSAPVRIDLAQFEGESIGIRVAADVPVAAGVVAVGDGGTAVTAGIPGTARTWLVPGLRTLGRDRGTLWLLNTSGESVPVSIGVLTGAEVRNSQEVLDPGAQVAIRVRDDDALGFVVDAGLPITVAWSVDGPSGAAFGTAIAVSDE